MDEIGTDQYSAGRCVRAAEKLKACLTAPDKAGSIPAAISPSYSLPREKIRNPLIAAFCGACCIGLGQFYNGRTLDGLAVWTGFLVPVNLAVTFPAFFGFFIFTAAGSGYTASMTRTLFPAGSTGKKLRLTGSANCSFSRCSCRCRPVARLQCTGR